MFFHIWHNSGKLKQKPHQSTKINKNTTKNGGKTKIKVVGIKFTDEKITGVCLESEIISETKIILWS